jgi:hypothetical protein
MVFHAQPLDVCPLKGTSFMGVEDDVGTQIVLLDGYGLLPRPGGSCYQPYASKRLSHSAPPWGRGRRAAIETSGPEEGEAGHQTLRRKACSPGEPGRGVSVRGSL